MRRAAAVIVLLSGSFAVPQVRAQAPARVSAARELLDAMQIGPTMFAGATSMIELQVKQNPELAPYRDVMLEWVGKYLTADAAIPELAVIYANTFTEAELQELTTFYRTPTGQKMVAHQPELTQQAAALGQKIALAHKADLEAMVRARASQLGKPSPLKVD